MPVKPPDPLQTSAGTSQTLCVATKQPGWQIVRVRPQLEPLLFDSTGISLMILRAFFFFQTEVSQNPAPKPAMKLKKPLKASTPRRIFLWGFHPRLYLMPLILQIFSSHNAHVEHPVIVRLKMATYVSVNQSTCPSCLLLESEESHQSLLLGLRPGKY